MPDAALTGLYDALAAEDEAARLEASVAILARVQDPAPSDPADLAQQVLDRLIRGLASGRKAARIGFSVTLTEKPALGPVLDRLEKATRSDIPQEERNHALGKLFGLEAMANSGVLPLAPAEQRQRFLDLLLRLAMHKTWIREQCGYVLLRLLSERKLADAVLTTAATHRLDRTPEGVALWIQANTLHPDMTPPSDYWRHGDPLHKANVHRLPQTLRESTQASEPEDEKQPQRGMWNPQPHFAWNIVFQNLTTSTSRRSEGKGSERKQVERIDFAKFWSTSVDSLFDASDERKAWGFSLASQMVRSSATTAAYTHLRHIFTPALTRCLTNHLSRRERYLHRAASMFVEALLATSDAAVPDIVAGLIQGGGATFDQRSRSKTLARLCGQCKDEGALTRLVEVLGDALHKAPAADGRAVADLMLHVVRAHKGSLSPVPGWTEQLLAFLAREAFMAQAQSSTAEDSPNADHSDLSSRLSSCLAVLLEVRADNLPSVLIRLIEPLVTYKGARVVELDGVARDALRTAWKRLQKHLKRSNASGSILLPVMILQLLAGDEDAVSVLTDLNDLPSDSTEAVGPLLDILLALVSKRSLLLRRAAESVMANVATDMTRDGLEVLYRVLETSETLRGQQDLFQPEEEEGSGSGSGSDSDSDSSGTSTPTSSASSAHSSTSASSELDRLNAALGEITHTTPYPNEPSGEEASTPPNQPDEGEASPSTPSSMDSDEMFRLDDQLATVFKQRGEANSTRNSKRTEAKEARDTVVAMKNRALDLLEVYIKRAGSRALALEILLPLVKLTRESHTRQICDRAGGLIRELGKRRAASKVDELDQTELLSLLDSVHVEASRQGSRTHATAVSQASLIISRTLLASEHGDGERVETAVGRYASLLEKWMRGEVRVSAGTGLFVDFVNWAGSVAAKSADAKRPLAEQKTSERAKREKDLDRSARADLDISPAAKLPERVKTEKKKKPVSETKEKDQKPNGLNTTRASDSTAPDHAKSKRKRDKTQEKPKKKSKP